MGLPIGEPHVRHKAMIDHWCYAGQPDEDQAAAGGMRVHIHTDRRSGPSPGNRSTWKAVACAGRVTIKYHESLVRRVAGLIYVPAIARLRSALPRSRAGGYPTI